MTSDSPTTSAAPLLRVNGDSMWLWCPGCADSHRIVIFGANGWTWNKSTTQPTVTPSIKVIGVQWAKDATFYKPRHAGVPEGGEVVCHSFLTDGQWQFLADSTHVLAGQTVPMVPLPDWLAELDDALTKARSDEGFKERLATRMREDKPLLDRLAEGPTGD